MKNKNFTPKLTIFNNDSSDPVNTLKQRYQRSYMEPAMPSKRDIEDFMIKRFFNPNINQYWKNTVIELYAGK